VHERGERFAHLQDGPQQQPFGFLAHRRTLFETVA
jgi:hypothetical protein